MILTTLCYLVRDDCYLMLHRIKKRQDVNEGKWIGVGGKLEGDESPEECAKREILEETGLLVRRLNFRAVITFVSDQWESEVMYLFTSDDFTGELRECDEGVLEWVPVRRVEELPIWEGDRIFLRRMRERSDFFSLKLVYRGDTLVRAVLWEDGEEKILRQDPPDCR